MPPEKRKKGKRKSDALLEAVESDDTASLSTLATGGEESIDPMDTVSDCNNLLSALYENGFKRQREITDNISWWYQILRFYYTIWSLDRRYVIPSCN